MKWKDRLKRWTAWLLGLAIAVGLGIPAASAALGTADLPDQQEDAMELTAAFDRLVYEPGDTVTVTLILRGGEFDAAGFCAAYDPQELTYRAAQPGDGFTLPVIRPREDSLELVAQADTPQSSSLGVTVAQLTFTAVTGGSKTLQFTQGSDAYLGGKACVAYNGYQELDVTARVAEDAAADAALRQAKADAVAALTADIEEKLAAGVTVAQRELLAQCLQRGRAAIHNAGSVEEVSAALENALNRAAEIVADSSADFPKLTSLQGDETGDGVVLEDVYPAFSPDQTVYFLSNNRPLEGTPRAFRAVTAAGVAVRFNGEPVTVAADGSFRFAVPFRALENISSLVLTDSATGLSTTYLFYSCGYGVSGGPTNTAVYDENGQTDKEHIGEAVRDGTVMRVGTSTERVRIGFDGTAPANQVFRAELVDSAGRVLQTFTTASDDDPMTQHFLSDVITLKPGMNWLLLRYCGVDRSRYEDGKPVETPAYRTTAIILQYTDPEEAERDPSLTDTALDAIHIWLDGSEDVDRMVPLDPEQRKYTVTLSADDFDAALSKQVVRMTVDTRQGQTVTVYGGNGIPQNRTLLKDGTYHIADYLDTEVPRSEKYTVTIYVTAKDGQHKDKYILTVVKEGKCAMVVPSVYRDREVVITPNDPYRTWNLTFASVGITDESGQVIDTAAAMADGRLTMESGDTTIFNWDGTVSSGNFVIELLKQGETTLKLIYDDGAIHLEDSVYLAVNYSAEVLKGVLQDAEARLKDDSRQYDSAAVRRLETVIDAEWKTYEKYKTASRRNLTQPQIQDINRGVNAVMEAVQELIYAEVAEEIIAFAPLPPEVAYQQVENSVSLAYLNLPKTLEVTLADGTETTLTGIKWDSDPEYRQMQEAAKRYKFTPVLPAGYKPARGVELPQIWVQRAEIPMTFDVRRWALPETCSGDRLLVPVGTAGAEDIMALHMQAHVRGDAYTPAPTRWENLDGYNGNQVGQYRFRAHLIENELDKTTNMRFVWSDAVPENRRTRDMIVQVFDLSMNQSALTVTVGDSSDRLRVDQSDYPANAVTATADTLETVGQRLVWTSSDPAVAAVDRSTGRLTALTAGKTTVTARLSGTELSASCQVTVVLDQVTVQPQQLTLAVDGTGLLTLAETMPRGTSVVWSSDNQMIATVDEDGLVTAHAPGQCVITVTVTLNGKTLTGTALVTVANGGGTGGDEPGPGGGDTPGGGTEPGGTPSGGTGTLTGQPTAGGEYQDLLTDPDRTDSATPPRQTTSDPSDTRQPETPDATQQPQPGSSSGGGAGGNGTGGHRLIAVDGEKGGVSWTEMLIIAGAAALLLVCGILRGRRVRGGIRRAGKTAGKALALLLAAGLLLTGIPRTAYAASGDGEEPAGYIVVSIEKLTLGQGYILEPQQVPYYSGENLAQVMDRVLKEQGRAYHYTGSLTGGFYLAEVEDPDRPGIANTVPAYIYDMWSALKAADPSIRSIRDTDTEEPDFLGEFDYFSQSGWMYSVNHMFPPVGASDCRPANGMVVRWQFTLVGLGGDLGGGSTTAAGSYTFMDRTELYTVLAAVRADSGLMADAKVRPIYDRLLAKCCDITTQEDAVRDDLNTLKKALGGNQITELSLPDGESGRRTCAYGTSADTAMAGFPTYLRAVIDGSQKLITGVSWRADSAFGAPGVYVFRPVLPEKYDRYTLTAALPIMQVTLLPPSGDVNGDTLLDIRDISRMAASAGRTDRTLCDLDGSGMTTWNDFRLLAAQLGGDALSAPGAPDTAPVTLRFDKESYAAGEVATAYIDAGAAGFDTFALSLSYDPEQLALDGVTLTEPLLQTGRADAAGVLRLGGASLEGRRSGDIVVVTFVVQKDGAAVAELTQGTALLYNGEYVTGAAGQLLPQEAPAAGIALLPGDLDGSGAVDMDDAIRLVEYCNDRANLSAQELSAADVNGDGGVDLTDAALLLQYVNGLIDALPVHRGQ